MKPLKELMQKPPDLSIIVPAFSEEKRIGHTLDELAIFLKNDKYFKNKFVEVIVVAADTTDRTYQIIRSKQNLFTNLRLLKPGKKVGKGRDVQYGMSRANGRYILFMDADLATPLHHIKNFYEACTEDNDLVIGTRNLLTYRSGLSRGLLARLGGLLWQLLSGIWVEDTQCGFKMFSKRAGRICFSKLTILGWGFDMEILVIARVNGLKIKALRINDWQDMPYSTHTDKPLKITIRMVKDFVKINVNRLRSVYLEN